MDANPGPDTIPRTEAPLGHGDVRDVFARAVSLGGAVIGAVRPDQLGGPTPCREYDVRDLLGHLVGVLRRVAVLGQGQDAFSGPAVVQDVADDAWPQGWIDAAHLVRDVWSDDSMLSRPVRLPWAEMSGGAALALYTSEVTVHTWDLATATGQHPVWDPQVLGVAFDASLALPAENRAAAFAAVRTAMAPEYRDLPDPFGEVVDVPVDAPLIDRLVAWTGRWP